jgi:hypothetical protein
VPQDLFLRSERDSDGVAWKTLILVVFGVTAAITGLWYAFRSVHKQNRCNMHSLAHHRAHARIQRANTTAPMESISNSTAQQQDIELGALQRHGSESLGTVTGVPLKMNPVAPTTTGHQNADLPQTRFSPIPMDTAPVQWCTAGAMQQPCEGRHPDTTGFVVLAHKH